MAIWNFSAGPAKLPEAVLAQAAAEMQDWQGKGVSIMEVSHRGPEYGQVADQAEADLRQLLSIPDDYAVLFMQGGASAQNALVPLNLLGDHAGADYIVSGVWSRKSFKEAQRYGRMRAIVDTAQPGPQGQAPDNWWPEPVAVDPNAAYLHLCSNETITGLEVRDLSPWRAAAGQVPLVLDMSSHILARPFDVTQVGMIYAGAQKNVGPAGVTLVIIRRDLLERASDLCPSVFNYAKVAADHSRLNTPPTYGVYLCGLVFQWLLKKGGLRVMAQENAEKACLLYQAIDQSAGFYQNHMQTAFRSEMNVSFFLRDESLTNAFLEGAKAQGLLGLKGHKAVGGIRASIYNAMPLAGVQALVNYLQQFQAQYG